MRLKALNKAVCGAALVLAGASAPALAIDAFFPTYGNRGIDVIRYDINLDVNPVSGAIKGNTALTIKAQRRLASFTLDLHGLTVSKVTVNGVSAAFGRAGDKLTITPRPRIAEGDVMQVAVTYAGTPDLLPDPTAAPTDGYFLGWFKYGNATYAVSEPVGASTFFPANDEPDDKAVFKFRITVPEGYTGVANGVFVGSTPVNGKRRFTWVMNQPMTTWLATVHVNAFKLKLSRAPDGTPIRVYASNGTPQTVIDGYAQSGRMLTYFERLIGPYPFGGYGTVIVDDPLLDYALETQAMSTFPSSSTPPDPAYVAHELAHQWLGNSVSVKSWEDLWIAEGSATYFETLWPNRRDPAAFDAAMLAIYDYVVAENLGPAVVEAPDQMFSDRTYYRGAATLYALRLQVGDSSFFNILRRFVQDNRGGNVTSETFIRTAVRFSGDASVRPLLEAWLYGTAVPALPGAAAKRAAPTGPVPRPHIFGSRCGRGSHRGASAACGQ